MNNPALSGFASQDAGQYAFNHPHPNAAYAIPPGTAVDHAQTPFQPGMTLNQTQKPISHPEQAHKPGLEHLYQQQSGQAGAASHLLSQSSYSAQTQGQSHDLRYCA